MDSIDKELKQEIIKKAQDLGADIVRSCSVSKWEELPIQQPEFWPQNIWPWVKNVIVLGIPLYIPMIDTTPSMVYQELYNTSNRVLDDIAYHLTNYITTKKGYRALYFPRDCYYNIEVLMDNSDAAFSHVVAAYYAGMGSIGDSHNLITKEFGPRIRLVSILTDAPIPPDDMQESNICIHCGTCLKKCPAQCFTENNSGIYAMDKERCTRHHLRIKNEHHWPCGICTSVCPVGDDLKKYRDVEVVTAAGVEHCQKHGS
ncbi:epoxyqueuosine reductase [Candidatus Methanomassiliicoccus intestinalis]|uniref:epoxyqueuosine reductase n=1 Tax=Candidatus Methanomassiliicoccus intestinalis TaxID=1406512 RepID=UPI0037DC6F66